VPCQCYKKSNQIKNKTKQNKTNQKQNKTNQIKNKSIKTILYFIFFIEKNIN